MRGWVDGDLGVGVGKDAEDGVNGDNEEEVISAMLLS